MQTNSLIFSHQLWLCNPPISQVFAQIQAGLLNGKSIGWLPTKAHIADLKEARACELTRKTSRLD